MQYNKPHIILLASSVICIGMYAIAPNTNTLSHILKRKMHHIGDVFKATKQYVASTAKGTTFITQPLTYEKQEMKKLFGYDLNIEYIKDTTETVCNRNRITLYFHGWGDSKKSARLLKDYCGVLPGDVLTFNFRDAQPTPFAFIRHANFGQLPDILTALYVLKYAKDVLKIDTIDLFGVSRGGAVIINMLAVLNDKTNQYDKALAQIGINSQERIALLALIQRGCIVLDCPLINLNTILAHKFPSLPMQKIMRLISKYDPNGLQALTSAEKLAGLKLNILLHFQHNDHIVLNTHNADYYKKLAQHHTTYLVLGNDGGHIHNHTALYTTVHTFKKMFGGAYNPSVDTFYHNQILLTHAPNDYKNILLQPGNHIEHYLHCFHQSCI